MVLSSSSLSEPPEELLSEAAGGTLLFASEAASVDENRVKKQLLPAALELEASRGSTLTALAVVLIGLFAGVAAARVHRRAAPGPGICTGTGNS